MIAMWYGVIGFMLVVYIVLDGRNFGVGILQRLVAKTPDERRQVMAAIGPQWSWHEVWLVAFGGTLVAVFPRLMASAFSGYYLALVLILWCLLIRGVSLEVVEHVNDRQWREFWDGALALSSVLLAVLFGLAGGNLVRGVPLDDHGNFSMAFFTDFGVRGHVGLLDWYTLSVATFAVVVLAAHGATYLARETQGPVRDRCVRYARSLWAATAPIFLIVAVESWAVRPDLPAEAIGSSIVWLGVIGIVISTTVLVSGLVGRQDARAVVGSNGLIASLLATGGVAMFPVMLHSTLAPANSLSAFALASDHTALMLASIWWPIGCVLAISYLAFTSRGNAGKGGV
jgi:cytochrome bd ubiquinol oxidase subunit II